MLHEPVPDVRAALDDLHGLGVQVLWDVRRQERGGARRELGRLHHHGVAGRQGSGERLQGQACVQRACKHAETHGEF